jgi:hypothetical protein
MILNDFVTGDFIRLFNLIFQSKLFLVLLREKTHSKFSTGKIEYEQRRNLVIGKDSKK